MKDYRYEVYYRKNNEDYLHLKTNDLDDAKEIRNYDIDCFGFEAWIVDTYQQSFDWD